MQQEEEWVEIQEAQAIAKRANKREISGDYIRLLAKNGRIRWKRKDGRQNLYLKSDLEQVRVKQHKKRASEDEKDEHGESHLDA